MIDIHISNMKTILALTLLAISSSNVFSVPIDINDVTFLQDAQNKHQCYNHCTRHNGKSRQWIDECKADCDEEYAPTPRYGCMRNSDCVHGQECKHNICVQNQRDYGCMKSKDCEGDQECKHNICIDKQRTYGCTKSKDCGRDQECKHNICVEQQRAYGCMSNLDCGHHMKCKNNMCMPKATEHALRGSNTE